MADKKIMHEQIEIPSGVTVTVEDNVVSVSGKGGKVQKSLNLRGAQISVEGKTVKVSAALRELNTILSHIRNLIHGCTQGYAQKMKIIHAHFPMSVQAGKTEVSIKNFIGEKKPRFARIIGDTKVVIKGAEVMVSGPSKEDVGQTVANLRSATKIRNLDSRIFQDGIYPVSE